MPGPNGSLLTMKPTYLPLSLIFLILSCKKEEMIHPAFSEAQYQITITGKWTSPEFTVPPGAHFTNFAGMVHNNNTSLWQVGNHASPGIGLMAEIGNGTILLAEADSIIAAQQAISIFLILGPVIAGERTANIYCNSNFSFVSMLSMLAPSPDWFVGVSGINLFSGNKWIIDTTINLYPHDAGTEEGDIFGYNNPATVPQQNIHLLMASQATVLANGNQLLAPIATARFTKR